MTDSHCVVFTKDGTLWYVGAVRHLHSTLAQIEAPQSALIKTVDEGAAICVRHWWTRRDGGECPVAEIGDAVRGKPRRVWTHSDLLGEAEAAVVGIDMTPAADYKRPTWGLGTPRVPSAGQSADFYDAVAKRLSQHGRVPEAEKVARLAAAWRVISN